MPKVKDIYNIIDGFAPFCTQCSWDNSSLAVGSAEAEVTKAAATLDITPAAVSFAREIGAELIISHHPVIFAPRKKVLQDDIVYMLIRAGISAICVHTPLDAANGGVNDALAEKLGFLPAFPLADSGEEAMVRFFEFKEEKTADEIAAHISASLGAAVRCSDCGKKIKKIAFCGGSGSDFIPFAAGCGADAFLTGDCSHHAFLDAVQLGVTVFAAGHYETEQPVVPKLSALISREAGIECAAFDCGSPCKTVLK